MNLLDAVKERHTVRKYGGRAIEGEALKNLQSMIAQANEKGNLHFQLVNGKENAFAQLTIHYGKWTGVTNYIALIGKEAEDLDERCGYYGEQIVLWALTQGLKTGWVDVQYTKAPDELDIPEGERLVVCIVIGYSDTSGNPHKLKSIEELSVVSGEMPEWFKNGMECARLAPSAGNQMLFRIHWDGENVSITSEPGFLEKVDLGIAKYHFEIGSGLDSIQWK